MSLDKVYYYPNAPKQNLYVARNIEILRSVGFETRYVPNSKLSLLKSDTKNAVLILNWFEDRLGYENNQMASFLKSIVWLLIFQFKFKKILWVIHNRKPHGNYNRFLYAILVKWLSRIADSKITHRNVESVNSSIIEHPLYSIDFDPAPVSQSNTFLIFGVVKRYKGIERLLKQWDPDTPLVIAGACNDAELTEEINTTICTRQLNVRWENRFLDYEELCELISKSKVVLLPHIDNSMIVSGGFYHAMTCGANIVTTNHDLYRSFKDKLPFIFYVELSSLKDELKTINFIDKKTVLEISQTYFHDKKIGEQWKSVITSSTQI